MITLAVTFALALTPAQLDQQLTLLASPDAKVRLQAAKTIGDQPPEAMELLAERLARPRSTLPDHFRRLFLEMWAQVPNWKGFDPMWIKKPEPPWTPPPRVKGQPKPKRPPVHDPETLDWVAALNELDLANPALIAPAPPEPPPKKGQEPIPVVPPPTAAQVAQARTDALEIVALMRGVAASKRMEAVDPIFKVAFDYEGVFRDECGRQIRSMESFAVPALIRLMHSHGPAALHLGKQRRYASYQLDRMDRARPAKAISAAPDDRVRSAIIHAYGEEKALEAVEAILNQVDAPSHRVRKEARWAWLRYVTGRPPPPAPKRKRKLTGGREEDVEKPDYLTYREIALLALQKQLAAIQNTPVDPKSSASKLTDELFAYYDAKHTAEWDEQFGRAQAKEQAGDLKGATDEFGWILAHDPNYARRAAMAPAFARYGDQLRKEKDLSRAVGFYRQAVDLDPEGPEAKRAQARVALLDGLQGLERGHADPGAFRRALSLDPALAEAKEGLSRADTLRFRRRWLEVAGSVAATFGLLFALWLLWRRTGKPTPENQPS